MTNSINFEIINSIECDRCIKIIKLPIDLRKYKLPNGKNKILYNSILCEENI